MSVMPKAEVWIGGSVRKARMGDTEGWKSPPQIIVAPICEMLKKAALVAFVQLCEWRSVFLPLTVDTPGVPR